MRVSCASEGWIVKSAGSAAADLCAISDHLVDRNDDRDSGGVQTSGMGRSGVQTGRMAYGQRCDENGKSYLVAPLGARAILSMWAPVRRWPARRAPTATNVGERVRMVEGCVLGGLPCAPVIGTECSCGAGRSSVLGPCRPAYFDERRRLEERGTSRGRAPRLCGQPTPPAEGEEAGAPARSLCRQDGPRP